MKWQHPWLSIELAIRAVLADRLTRGPNAKVDQVLMARVKERDQIARRLVQLMASRRLIWWLYVLVGALTIGAVVMAMGTSRTGHLTLDEACKRARIWCLPSGASR